MFAKVLGIDCSACWKGTPSSAKGKKWSLDEMGVAFPQDNDAENALRQSDEQGAAAAPLCADAVPGVAQLVSPSTGATARSICIGDMYKKFQRGTQIKRI